MMERSLPEAPKEDITKTCLFKYTENFTTKKKKKNEIFKTLRNMPIQITENFTTQKNEIVQIKNLILFIFLLKHILWVLVRTRLDEAVLTSTHNLCFLSRNK